MGGLEIFSLKFDVGGMMTRGCGKWSGNIFFQNLSLSRYLWTLELQKNSGKILGGGNNLPGIGLCLDEWRQGAAPKLQTRSPSHPNLRFPTGLKKDNTVQPWYKDHFWAAAKVVFIVRWSLYWGGRGCDLGCINYDGVYRKTWTGCAKSGLYSKVDSISRWSLTKVRL